MTDFHILFVGGKQRNVPSQKIRCLYTQYQVDSPEFKSCKVTLSTGAAPNVILCFKDFCSHKAFWKYKEKALENEIPFFISRGGVGSLIGLAKKRGLDLSEHFNMQIKEIASLETPKAILPWKDRFPRNASKELIVADERKVFVATNNKGSYSLVLKGEVLDLAIKIAQEKNFVTKDKSLTHVESESVLAYLDEVLGLTERGISIHALTVFRNVNCALGFVEKRVSSKKIIKKEKDLEESSSGESTGPKDVESLLEHAVKLQASIDKASESPEAFKPFNIDPKDLREPEIKNPLEVYLAEISLHIKNQDNLIKRLEELYGKNVKLSSENAAFLEQIVRLEEDLKKKTFELDDLRAQLIKWKELATK